MYIFLNISNKYQKVLYVLLMIFLFSIIYTFFPNEDFAGWIELSNNPVSFIDKYKIKIDAFSKYALTYKDFMTRDEFMKIPVMKVKNYLYVVNTDTDTKTSTTSTKMEDLKNILFDIYALDNKMSLDEFASLPFRYDYYNISDPKLVSAISMSSRYTVSDYFDRLYFSAITQTTVGYGDIFPATRILRFITLLQAISTIFIIVA